MCPAQTSLMLVWGELASRSVLTIEFCCYYYRHKLNVMVAWQRVREQLKDISSPSKNIEMFFIWCFTRCLATMTSSHAWLHSTPYIHTLLLSHTRLLPSVGFQDWCNERHKRIYIESSLARGRPGGILSPRLYVPKPITPCTQPGVYVALSVQSSRKIAYRFSWPAQQALLGVYGVTRVALQTRISAPNNACCADYVLNRNKVIRLITFITLYMLLLKELHLFFAGIFWMPALILKSLI